MNFNNMIPSIYDGKKVLLTGHTGFKGAWLAIWLERMGAKVIGVSLDPPYPKSVFELSGIGKHIQDYRVDIRHFEPLVEVFTAEAPDMVFHLAAQPLVLTSYQDPLETFETNTLGTANVLEAIRRVPTVKAAIMVTTDKCYENYEWEYGYRESDPMGGHDPYSASKGAAELIITSYRRSFFSTPDGAAIASARAGNVIGGGDWAANRLVPDIIRAIENDQVLEVRSPGAVRPWQHVLEPLGGYLLLGARLLEDPRRFAGPWNFGPLSSNVFSVKDLVESFLDYYGAGQWRDTSVASQPHEANLLMLEISKAMQRLRWMPILSFQETIDLTAQWYTQYLHRSVLELCREQIDQYNSCWEARNGRSLSGEKVLP